MAVEKSASDHYPDSNMQNTASPEKESQEKTSTVSTTETEDGAHLRFGWFGFTPKWLQWANNAFVYCILLTTVFIFQVGVTIGLAGVIQSSIERRFQFTTQQLSWVIVSYELFSLPVTIFITWLGTVGCHRPRWVAGCLLASCIGCLFYAMPHFVTGVYQPGGVIADEEDFLCSNRTGTDLCGEDGEDSDGVGNEVVLTLLILARCCLSLGAHGLYTLGITFLDDSLTKAKFSLYASVIYMGGVLGPALGFIGGGWFLSIYSEWPNISGEDVGLDPNDPRWVGAWWLPLMLFGAIIFLHIIPLSGYPADFPESAEVRAKKTSEAYDVTTDEIPEDMRHIDFTRRDLWPYTKALFTNWTFIFLYLYICCDMSILSALGVFGVKYIEVQFGMPAAQAGSVVGLLMVPAGLIGAVGAGMIIDSFKLSIKGIMKIELVGAVFVLFTTFMFLVQCDQADFAGVNTPYTNKTDLNLTDSCNVNCMCDDLPYSPLCSHDDVQYFSPCHAGCMDRVEEDGSGMGFYNCSCIPHNPGTAQGSWSTCPAPNCPLWLYCLLLFLGANGLFMATAMNISCTIRCVANKHRIYSMFIGGMITRFLGSTPGPLILAACFDGACTLWQEICGQTGSCFHYDNVRLGYFTFTYALLTKLMSVLFIFLAWWLYRPPRTTDTVNLEASGVPCDTENSMPLDALEKEGDGDRGLQIQTEVEMTQL